METLQPRVDSLQQSVDKLRKQIEVLEKLGRPTQKSDTVDLNNIILEIKVANRLTPDDLDGVLSMIGNVKRTIEDNKEVEALRKELIELENKVAGMDTLVPPPPKASSGGAVIQSEPSMVESKIDSLAQELDQLKIKLTTTAPIVVNTLAETASNPNTPPKPADNDKIKEQDYIESVLFRQIASISDIITTKIDINAEPMFLKDLYRNDLPRLERAARTIQEYLDRFVKLAGYNTDTKDLVLNELQAIDQWIRDLRAAYNKEEIYNFSPQTREGAAEIGVFNGTDDLIVYDFLKKFTTYTSAPTNHRADRLYNHHLAPAIKNRIPHLASDLKGIKQYLIAEFGRLEYIIDQAMLELESKKVPHNPSIHQRFEILTAISNTLTKLSTLANHSEIDSKTLDDYISTNMFMTRAIKLLPERDYEDFLKTIAAKGLDARHISGRLSFDSLIPFFALRQMP